MALSCANTSSNCRRSVYTYYKLTCSYSSVINLGKYYSIVYTSFITACSVASSLAERCSLYRARYYVSVFICYRTLSFISLICRIHCCRWRRRSSLTVLRATYTLSRSCRSASRHLVLSNLASSNCCCLLCNWTWRRASSCSKLPNYSLSALTLFSYYYFLRRNFYKDCSYYLVRCVRSACSVAF